MFNLQVGVVNCQEQDSLCSQHHIRGYPTLKALIPGSGSTAGSFEEYKGSRSASDMQSWLLSRLPNQVQRVDSMSALKKLLGLCQPGSKKATSALCVLLITDKAETSSLYKALSTAYQGKVKLTYHVYEITFCWSWYVAHMFMSSHSWPHVLGYYHGCHHNDKKHQY